MLNFKRNKVVAIRNENFRVKVQHHHIGRRKKGQNSALITRFAMRELLVANGAPLLQRGRVFNRLGAFENVEHGL